MDLEKYKKTVAQLIDDKVASIPSGNGRIDGLLQRMTRLQEIIQELKTEIENLVSEESIEQSLTDEEIDTVNIINKDAMENLMKEFGK